MDFKKLKILLVNNSDNRGGAAVVTHRLMDALCAEGVDARMLVVHKDTQSLRVSEAASPKRARIPFLAEHADIYLRNGRNRSTLFHISTGKYGLPLSRHPWVQNADVVILNWVNQGTLSLREIERIARVKPVIWTMHDQWNMTGVCHYTAHCMNFLTGCDNCHLVPHSKLAQRVFESKMKLYHQVPIHFVSVSTGLMNACRKSPLMVDAEIDVIPSPLPISNFKVTPALSRLRLGLPEGKRIVVMGAARLDDPVKDLPLAIDTLNRLGDPVVFPVFFGRVKDKSCFEALRIPYLWLGPIDNRDKLQSLFAYADVVLSTSQWETLPGTIVEGIACGAAAVATNNGGQEDIIDAGKTGYIAKVHDLHTPEEKAVVVAEALRSALNLPADPDARNERHNIMAARFGAPAIARRYINLCNKLLQFSMDN